MLRKLEYSSQPLARVQVSPKKKDRQMKPIPVVPLNLDEIVEDQSDQIPSSGSSSSRSSLVSAFDKSNRWQEEDDSLSEEFEGMEQNDVRLIAEKLKRMNVRFDKKDSGFLEYEGSSQEDLSKSFQEQKVIVSEDAEDEGYRSIGITNDQASTLSSDSKYQPTKSDKKVSQNSTKLSHQTAKGSNQRIEKDQTNESRIRTRQQDFTPETQRKCQIADSYFLDYYHDLLSYLHQRKERLEAIKEELKYEGRSPADQQRRLKLHFAKESVYLRIRRSQTSSAHFNILSQIGQGGYGQVFLAKKKDTGEVCALKKMSKKLLSKMNEIHHVISERDILVQARSPWLVKLLYAFQDFSSIYLAMEYVPGGDMRTLLNNSGILHERDAHFYAAEMLISINELHRLGFIHRDLKPENFLIDRSGHLKLTDFGLSKGGLSQSRASTLHAKMEILRECKIINYTTYEKRQIFGRQKNLDRSRAYSLVGSPDYMAPEVLLKSHHSANSSSWVEGYDYAIDYWSIGCIIFEMLAGYPPFVGENPDEVWVNLFHWQEVLERPVYDDIDAEFNLTDESWDFINRLIAHRNCRIASLEEAQSHPWFGTMNQKLINYEQSKKRGALIRPPSHGSVDIWANIRNLPRGVCDPPFVPELRDELDNRHFDDFSNPESMQIYKEVYEKMDRLNADQANPCINSMTMSAFLGFAYRHKGALEWESIMGRYDQQMKKQHNSSPNEPKLSYFKRLQKRLK